MESSDEDEYRPAGRGRSTRRPSQRAVAAAAAAAASDGDGSVGAAPTVRWERGMVTGPCTNPDCEHPYDSPQWRKGPAQCPILCNACGTRWLRNGTLKPLVVSPFTHVHTVPSESLLPFSCTARHAFQQENSDSKQPLCLAFAAPSWHQVQQAPPTPWQAQRQDLSPACPRPRHAWVCV